MIKIEYELNEETYRIIYSNIIPSIGDKVFIDDELFIVIRRIINHSTKETGDSIVIIISKI
jgi:hypothetical protein